MRTRLTIGFGLSAAIFLLTRAHGAALPQTLQACGAISEPGTYVLEGDLIAMPGQTCLEVHDTSHVQIDCQGHAILSMGARAAMTVARTSALKIQDCAIRDVGTIGLHLADSRGVQIRHSRIGGMNVNAPSAGQARDLDIQDNEFTEYYQQFHTRDSVIRHNRFRLPADSGGAAAVLSMYGSGNEISGNEVDGGWLADSKPPAGPRDGLVLGFESHATVRNNQISNAWNCGIQTVGRVEETSVTENTIRNAGLCGIGGWDWASWRHNAVSNNRFDQVGLMFLFSRRYGLTPEEREVFFEDNEFVGNRAASYAYADPSGYTASFDFHAPQRPDRFGATLTAASFRVRNNLFRDNDFGQWLKAPRLADASLAVDGGRNLCQSSENTAYPLACGRLDAGARPATFTAVAESLRELRAYPNPWRADRAPERRVVFDHLSGNCTVKLFTISGHWVRTLRGPGPSLEWNLTNDGGESVASGHYLYLATNDRGEKATGKIAVIR
jgi:hypothetical protein